MTDATQLLLLVVAVGFLHMLVFALVMRWNQFSGEIPRADPTRQGGASRDGGQHDHVESNTESRSVTGNEIGPSLDTDVETVRCPNCGAENEAAYHYCRLCVSELHGGPAGVVPDSSPTRGHMGR